MGVEQNEGVVVLSDMSMCGPSKRLSREFAHGCWKLVDYETEDGISGVMAFGDPEDEPGEIVLPLGIAGRYHIFIGVNYTRTPYADVIHRLEHSLYGQTWVKLTDDLGFSRIGAEVMWRHAEKFTAKTGREMDMWKSVQETYWKTADVTGRDLVISRPKPPYDGWDLKQIANISYVKLVPADDDVIDAGTQPSTEATKCGVMLWCTCMLTGHTQSNPMYHPTDKQWYLDEFAPLVDSDIGTFVFEAIRGNLCAYHTQIGDVGTHDGHWPANWVDPLRTFTDLAHDHGMEAFASMRMIGKGFPMGRHPISWARFLAQHPQWAKRDRDGMPASNVSLAFPEVIAYWLSLIRETLDYGIDGVQLHLNRSFPFVLYEEPTVQSFMDQYGEDPRKLPDDDVRWIEHNRMYLTAFVRAVSGLVKGEYGKKLAVTVNKPPVDQTQLIYKITCAPDLETWLREGLVDIVVPNPKVTAEQVNQWQAWSDGRVSVWADLQPRTQPGEAYVKLAKKYYAMGVSGYALWDGERRMPRMSEWAVLRKLGHVAHLDRLAVEAEHYYRNVPLRYLDGLSVRYSYEDG